MIDEDERKGDGVESLSDETWEAIKQRLLAAIEAIRAEIAKKGNGGEE
jgi:hypothetical protein